MFPPAGMGQININIPNFIKIPNFQIITAFHQWMLSKLTDVRCFKTNKCPCNQRYQWSETKFACKYVPCRSMITPYHNQLETPKAALFFKQEPYYLSSLLPEEYFFIFFLLNLFSLFQACAQFVPLPGYTSVHLFYTL